VNFPEVPRGAEKDFLTSSSIPSKGYVDSIYKIYAGNLGWGVSSEALKEAFSNQSGLLGAKVIFDRITGRSRGFGFVSFASPDDAQAALESMNGVVLSCAFYLGKARVGNFKVNYFFPSSDWNLEVMKWLIKFLLNIDAELEYSHTKKCFWEIRSSLVFNYSYYSYENKLCNAGLAGYCKFVILDVQYIEIGRMHSYFPT
jgi:RNA recognition motif-containing protein